MSQNDLRNLLTQLHARLGNVSSVDDEERQLLATVQADIEHLLANGGGARSTPGARLESLAVRFEADHPALAETLRRLADSLGKAGI